MMPIRDSAEFIDLMKTIGRDENGKSLNQSSENKSELNRILKEKEAGLMQALERTHKGLLAYMHSYCTLNKEYEALEKLMKEMSGEKNDD